MSADKEFDQTQVEKSTEEVVNGNIRNARAVEQGVSAIQMMQKIFVGQQIKDVFPIFGPHRTFTGMNLIMESGSVIVIEVNMVEVSQDQKVHPILSVTRTK